MLFTKKSLVRLVVVLFVIGTACLGIFLYKHRRLSPTSTYFDPNQRQLNTDERKTVALLEPLLQDSPSNFKLYKDQNFPVLGWKYSLAFTGYGIANIAAIDPSPQMRAQLGPWLDNVIQRMQQKPVWQDWQDKGWGCDPLVPSNVMWKGHLNLLYALHGWITGSDKYTPYFHKLSASIAAEMQDSDFGGARCESINYYFQCNTVSMLSLRYHDLFFGTHYEQLEDKWLDWARKNLMVPGRPGVDKGAGLIYAVYHPNSQVVEKRLSGYTNAWALTYLHFFDPKQAEDIYFKSFKPTFIHPLGPIAYADEVPGAGMDGLSSLFAAIAAKEMGDQDLFNKLMNLFSLAGWEQFRSANPEFSDVGNVVVNFPKSLPLQGPLLFAKTNVGVSRLFQLAQQEKIAALKKEQVAALK